MTQVNVYHAILAALAGMLIAGFWLSGLWYTVNGLKNREHPYVFLGLSSLGRIALVVGLFIFIANLGLSLLIWAIVGFLVTRLVSLGKIHRNHPLRHDQEKQVDTGDPQG